MFYATDLDKNGVLDFDEFHRLLIEMKRVEEEENSDVKNFTSKATVSKSDAQKLFKVVDEAGNGTIDLKEFKVIPRHSGGFEIPFRSFAPRSRQFEKKSTD